VSRAQYCASRLPVVVAPSKHGVPPACGPTCAPTTWAAINSSFRYAATSSPCQPPTRKFVCRSWYPSRYSWAISRSCRRGYQMCRKRRSGRAIGRVGRWRGGLGTAYLLPALSSAGASIAVPCSVSTLPLVKPDVRISRIRLSDKNSCGRPRNVAVTQAAWNQRRVSRADTRRGNVKILDSAPCASNATTDGPVPGHAVSSSNHRPRLEAAIGRSLRFGTQRRL
jgi:hypothetical protein